MPSHSSNVFLADPNYDLALMGADREGNRKYYTRDNNSLKDSLSSLIQSNLRTNIVDLNAA
ncbi:MAG: hypothetical protein HY965_08025 [Ignavibacteriales bacterium]|nr:hypothetical protein [Ignavibacteriales bacterium]